eukprot:scaffold127805_cov73-Phaeocystis_antarctica.AAC.1
MESQGWRAAAQLDVPVRQGLALAPRVVTRVVSIILRHQGNTHNAPVPPPRAGEGGGAGEFWVVAGRSGTPSLLTVGVQHENGLGEGDVVNQLF